MIAPDFSAPPPNWANQPPPSQSIMPRIPQMMPPRMIPPPGPSPQAQQMQHMQHQMQPNIASGHGGYQQPPPPHFQPSPGSYQYPTNIPPPTSIPPPHIGSNIHHSNDRPSLGGPPPFGQSYSSIPFNRAPPPIIQTTPPNLNANPTWEKPA
jgi:hypothetical protein